MDDFKLLKEDMLAFIDPGVAEDDIEYTVSVEHHNFIRWFDILDRISAQQREPVVRDFSTVEIDQNFYFTWPMDKANEVPAQDSGGNEACSESEPLGKSNAALAAPVGADVNDGGQRVQTGNEVVAAGRDRQPIQSSDVAIGDIAAERRRQVEVEGWTPEHDDEHERAEMACAAACYALSGTSADDVIYTDGRWKDICDLFWPWSSDWWKPKDRRRDLVRAGALIVAEIERLDRLASSGRR